MNPRYTNTIQKPDSYQTFTGIFNSRIFPYILFLIIIIIVYFRSIMFGFTELDDLMLVVSNSEYLSDPYNIIAAFFKSVFNVSEDTFYRPLLMISWMIDTIIGGGRIWVYHLFDIVYHFIAVCILFNLLKNLNFTRSKAIVFTSFFAVLPILNQAVSWIPGRNDTLLAIFLTGSFLFIVKYNSSDSFKHLFLAVFLFLAALFTKETAFAGFVVFPAYIFLYRKGKTRIKITLTVFLMTLCCFIWYFMKNSFTGSGEMSIFHIVTYIKIAAIKFFPATLQYISKIFFPVNLKVMATLSIFDVVSGLAVSALIARLLFKTKTANFRNVFFGLIWFLGFLVLPYFQNTWFILEHRTYIAILGLILILNEIQVGEKVKEILPYLLALYFMFFIAVSFVNNIKFANQLNFATAAMLESPHNVKTTFLYGRRFLDNGTFQTGGFFMKKNFEDLPMAEKRKESSNSAFLGLFAWQRGDIKEAKKYLTIAAEKNTLIHQTYAALADIYIKEERYEEALYNMKKAFKMQPENPEYYRYLKLSFEKLNSKE